MHGNQIGEYFRALPEAEGTAGAADHLRRYWASKNAGRDRRLRQDRRTGAQPVAARAIAELKTASRGVTRI